MHDVQILDDRDRARLDTPLSQNGRQVQHTPLVGHPMIGRDQQLHIGDFSHQLAQRIIQNGNMAARFRVVRSVHVHRIVSGGDEGKIVMLRFQSRPRRVDRPAVDLQGIYAGRVASGRYRFGGGTF